MLSTTIPAPVPQARRPLAHYAEDIDRRVFAEQIALALRFAPVGALSACAIAAIAWLSVRPLISTELIAGWFLGLLGLAATRYLLLRSLQAAGPISNTTPFTVATFFLGLLWGLCATLSLTPDALQDQLLPLLMIAALAAKGAATLVPVRRAPAAFVLPLVLPFAAHMLLLGERAYAIAAVGALVYAALLLLAARGIHRAIEQNLRLRFVNQELAQSLERAQRASRQTDHEIKREIIERVKAEAQVQEDEAWLTLLHEQAPIACIEWTPEFTVTGWNSGATKLFGYSAAEVMGQDGLGLLVPHEARGHARLFLNRLMRGEGSQQARLKTYAKSGGSVVCDWYTTPLRDSVGRVTRIASLALEVAAHRERKYA
jgi:PAS domain S-box-containing protein